MPPPGTGVRRSHSPCPRRRLSGRRSLRLCRRSCGLSARQTCTRSPPWPGSRYSPLFRGPDGRATPLRYSRVGAAERNRSRKAYSRCDRREAAVHKLFRLQSRPRPYSYWPARYDPEQTTRTAVEGSRLFGSCTVVIHDRDDTNGGNEMSLRWKELRVRYLTGSIPGRKSMIRKPIKRSRKLHSVRTF